MINNKLLVSLLFLGLSSISAYSQKYLVDDFVTNKASNAYITVSDQSDGINSPVDLDFNKNDMSELWVISMRTENSGGNTVTLRNAGKSNQKAYLKTDGNAWHFMSLPTALAFGINGAWASSPGVYDANHRGGAAPPFTGPTLWSSDFSIYALYAGPGTNGSHLDMLHGSPYSAGIAWEVRNQYWLFDGFHGHLVMYDFAIDHGPGNSNHDDGRIRRYPDIKLKRDGVTPSHMEFDAARKWLYINDIGNARIIRVDVTTGNVKGVSAISPMETLAENLDMQNVTMEVVANTGLTKPCGLDVFGDRLIITDNATNEIIVYDISKNDGTFPLIGRMTVPFADIMGIKLDANGKIWFVDKSAKKVIRIDNENVKKRNEDGGFVSIEEVKTKTQVSMFPNPATSNLNITGFAKGASIHIYDMTGRIALNKQEINSNSSTINLSSLIEGMYMVTVQVEGEIVYQNKLIKK